MIATEPESVPPTLFGERVVIKKTCNAKYTNSVRAKVSGGVERNWSCAQLPFTNRG